MNKPHLFIGSSVEGKSIAEAIQLNLEYDVYSTIWYQGVFGLSSGTLESLVNSLKNFDFAALILTPDDLLTKRGQVFSAVRDNVLFELGLFVGYLGRERTFIIHPRDKAIHLPTDLAGVTAATYETPARQTLQAALGAVCTRLKTAIGNTPPRGHLEGDSNRSTIYSELQELRGMVATLIDSSSPRTQPQAISSMVSLEGAWENEESNSRYYCQAIEGQLYIVYCYIGNNEATGEFSNLQLFGNEILGKFSWFNNEFSGYVWLSIEGPDLLRGGWWYSHDVEDRIVREPSTLRSARGMNPSTWRRLKIPRSKYPEWADRFFREKERQL